VDWKPELVAVPVSDVDRAKAFYTEQVGFNADHDRRVSEVHEFPWGSFVFFKDPDGNGWSVQAIPDRGQAGP
jgi:catechol 2,3-dioxygenase-like lactoylglutathione lyase family enzyme